MFARALEGDTAADEELFELAQHSDKAVDALAALASAAIERERRELSGPPAWEIASCDQAIAAVGEALGWSIDTSDRRGIALAVGSPSTADDESLSQGPVDRTGRQGCRTRPQASPGAAQAAWPRERGEEERAMASDELDAAPDAVSDADVVADCERSGPASCPEAAESTAEVVAEAVPEPVHWVEALAELHRWSAAALTAGPDVPVFGSAAWCALADEDPAKAFAAGRAAMAWWASQDQTARQRAADHVEASHAIAAAQDWTAVATEPDHAELERRRLRAG